MGGGASTSKSSKGTSAVSTSNTTNNTSRNTKNDDKIVNNNNNTVNNKNNINDNIIRKNDNYNGNNENDTYNNDNNGDDDDDDNNNDDEYDFDHQHHLLLHHPDSANNPSAYAAEVFEHAALSLDCDNDDLLFNLLYFSGGSDGINNPDQQFRVMINSAMEETVALYSENNTPYKLRPASQETLNSIKSSVLTIQHNDKVCMVCRDDMEMGCDVIELPSCSHCFHKECIIRWLQMQGWCPICRTKITDDVTNEKIDNEEKINDDDKNTKYCDNKRLEGTKKIDELKLES